MAARFIPNQVGMRQIGFMPGIATHVGNVADEIANAARRFAPIDEGDYIAGIEASHGTDSTSALGRVNANDWKSGLIEFGTGPVAPTPTFAPLRRGAQSCGFTLKSEFGSIF